ncbi:MAG: TonB-dependent receptor [Bacteroidota bacterium]|nr:TonB-dependent receptor [Bacteroidota bacterium]
MKRAVFFSLLLITAANLCAQKDSSERKDTIELLPVEVRSVRASSSSPFAKTNIGKEEIIKQNLGQDLPFILNQTPSVVINSDAGNGFGYTGIRIRGSDATRINVTLNGVPFNDPESGGTFFVDLPDFISSVNSIQVQRGVGTSSNGAGAFGGSIHLSTNETNKKAYVEFNNSYGSFNSLKNTLKIGSGLLGKHFTADVRISRISSDGYIDRATSDLSSYYLSTAYLSGKTGLRFNVFSGKEKTYQAWYGVSETDLKNNRRVNYAGTEKQDEPYDNETDNYKQDHYQFFFNQKISASLVFNTGLFYIKGKGYYEQYKADEKYVDYGLAEPTIGSQVITNSDFIRQLWLDNDYYGNIFSLQHSSGKTQLNIGGSVAKYEGQHYGEVVWAKNGLSKENARWYHNPAEKTDANVYGKWQQDLSETFQISTDVQWRTVRHAINGFRDNALLRLDRKYHFFNPKLGMSYRNNGLLVFASYAIANKEPNRNDFEASPEELPRHERLHDIELGIEYKSKKYNLGAGFYYMNYKDQLVLTGKINDVGAFTRTNIDNSYRAGIELQADISLTNRLKVMGNLALSRNRIKDFTEYIDDYDNGGQKSTTYDETTISFSPSVVGGATLNIIPFKNFTIDLIGKYVGKQYLDNTSNSSRKLNPFYIQDFRAVYSFNKKWLKNALIIAQANNLFNKKYEPNGYTFSYYYNAALTTENFYFPMAGTNWMVGVNLRF